MTASGKAPLAELVGESSIRLGQSATDRFDAVRQCGAALVEAGAVTDRYVETMLERERAVPTYIGEGVAIPHGTLAGKDEVEHPAVVVLGFPDGVEWADGEQVKVCIGLAAPAGGHVGLVARLAEILLDPALAKELRDAGDARQVRVLLGGDS